MKFATRYLVAAALAAAPVSLAAQTGQPQPQGEHQQHQGRRGERGHMQGRGGGPVQRILAQREQLGLSADQVARLEAIGRDLQARNAPLQQQLIALFPERAQRGPNAQRARGERRARPDSAARGQRLERGERPRLTEEQRQQREQRRAQAEPIMQQMRANGQQALEQVRGVLTDQQEAQVQQWLEHRGEDRERGERRQRRGRRGEQPRGGAGQSR